MKLSSAPGWSRDSAPWDGGRIVAGSTAGAYDLQYFTIDHLGSVRVVTGGSGNVVFSSGYMPYGTGTNTAGSAMNEFRFSGKEVQPQAGLLDFGARFYDPRSASWLSLDPMAEKYYSLSPYAYCANDPLNLVDPEGMDIIIIYSDETGSHNFHYSGKETLIPDNDYVRSVISAYQYNKRNWEKSGFNGNSPSTTLVEDASIRVYVYSKPTKEALYYKGNGAIPYIIWNPYEGSLTDNKVVLSPASIFAHEADHAVFDFINPSAHSEGVKTTDPLYENKEERRVITQSEQKTALANGDIKKGQVTRKNHLGKTVYTTGVTSSIIDKYATNYYYNKYNR